MNETIKKLQVFWQSKKWCALALSVIVVIAIPVVNKMLGITLDAKVIFAVIGLNAVYIIRQGSIDSKKTGENAFKSAWESKKFMALALGNVVPIIVGIVNVKYKLGLDASVVMSLIGLDGVYQMAQGAIDAKQPNEH